MSVSLGDLSSEVRLDASDPVLAHAASELREHLRGREGRRRVVLEAGSETGDGFIVVAGDDITVRGDSSRGALNGVYWLLERLGWLWVRPGAEGSRFVSGHSLAQGAYREQSAFSRRTLILGNDALHDEWPNWIEFASRNRYNSVFFHDTPPSALDRDGTVRPLLADEIASDGRGWMFERWDSDGAAIRSNAARRAISLQFGGHHLPAMLPRGLFAGHPDWFPVRNGTRDARYNLCTSRRGALAEVRARAAEFFRRFGGAQVYHLWADDIVGGGWCECPDCAGLSPSDQALRATNVLAEALAEVDSRAEIAQLAYHDTIAPPTRYLPAGNVSALYAPRNRNYAFSIADPSCSRNVHGHFDELLGLAHTFRGRAGALAVFEYYSDAILYKWLDPPNVAVLPQDAQDYRDAGVFDFGNLAVTPRPWIGPTWHAWWFARCAWDANVDREASLRDFCDAAFEGDGPLFAGLFRTLDSAYRELLDLGDLERIPRHDVLDFSDTPRDALTRKALQLRTAVETMNSAVSDVPLASGGLGPAYRGDLAVQLAYANHLAHRISAWDQALAGNRTKAEGHLGLATSNLNAVIDWDRVHSSPAYANLSRNMLRSASWHTERVARLLK